MRRGQKLTLSLLLVLAAGINLFWHIGSQAVEPFDEARHAVSALEMLHSGNYLVNTWRGATDFWNAKPPLSFWGTAAGLKIMANPFVGIRLVSLLAALVTILLCFRHARALAGLAAGLLAAALLITLPALILLHGARTADPDMLYTMLIAAAFLALAQEARLAWCAGYFLLGLGFLTKSFHVAPYGLAALLYMGWRLRRREITPAGFLLPPLLFLAPVLPWAVARYQVDGTVFFQCMLYNDVIRRGTQVIESHNEPIYDYVVFLLREFGLAALAALVLVRQPGTKHLLGERRVRLVLLWLVVPLITYSLAKSRMESYTYPMLPAAAVLLAVIIVRGLEGAGLKRRRLVLGLLALSLVYNEAFILERLHKRDHIEDPELAAMVSIARAAAPARVTLYLEDVQDTMWLTQDDYATAALLGNVDIRDGGRDGFARDAAGLLITTGGQVIRHQP